MYRKGLYTIILFFITFQLFAQSREIRILEKKLKSASETKEIIILNRLSFICLDFDVDKSIDYGKKALKKTKKVPTSDRIKSQLYTTLGEAYFIKKRYRKSLNYYEQNLKIIQSKSSQREIAKAYYNIAVLYQKSGRKKNAEDYFQESLKKAQSSKIQHLIIYNYHALYKLYDEWGKTTKAFEALKNYTEYKDKSLNISKRRISILREEVEIQQRLIEESELIVEELEEDTLEKSKTIKDLNIEKELTQQLIIKEREVYKEKQKTQQEKIKTQKLQNYIMGGIILVAFIIGFIILRGFLIKKKTNKILLKKNTEIQNQKEEILTQNEILIRQKQKIENHNKHITASITYAKRIQTAMLHGESVLKDSFNEYFILNKPRDIVSGDFFWVKQIKNFIVIAVADCTGHGVPGAFMSMLGISLLNENVTSRRIDSAGEILNTLRKKIKLYLKQTGKNQEAKDGMDMALCSIDTENNIILFAGAFNPLYLIRNNELIIYKATRNPIGIYIKEKDFNTQKIQLQKNDSIYMFSDGYIDQFGGEKNTKFRSNRFKELLIANADKPMTEQKKILNDNFSKWKGSLEQVDDVIVMGVKI